MRLVPQLVEVGRSAAGALREQENWIHRRVESLTFPEPDVPIYRRHVSIDFSIPPGLKSIDDETPRNRAARYYVPLSILTKWPPLHRLDLRGEDGRPVPFLTGRQNQLLDAAVLVTMAEDATTAEDATSSALSPIELRQVAQIALARGKEAHEAFSRVCPPLDNSPDGTVSAGVQALRADPTFVGLAQLLCHNTILWLRTEGEPEDREIVKFAYDVPWSGQLRRFELASFGLSSVLFEFETPHVGSSGSYHLNITVPAPLQAIDSELVLYDASQDAVDNPGSISEIDPARIQHVASPGHTVRLPYNSFEAYTNVSDRRAKFYISGERHGLAGRVRVAVKADVHGFVANASLGAALIAAVMGVFAAEPSLVMKNVSAAVAVLLVAPALLAYLLRPAEHMLTGAFVAGLRQLAILSGTWSLVAATLVIAISAETALRWTLASLALLGFLTALGLALPLIQARRTPK